MAGSKRAMNVGAWDVREMHIIGTRMLARGSAFGRTAKVGPPFDVIDRIGYIHSHGTTHLAQSDITEIAANDMDIRFGGPRTSTRAGSRKVPDTEQSI